MLEANQSFLFALASSVFSGGNLESIAGECHGWQKEVNAVIRHKEVRFNTIFDMLILRCMLYC